MSRVIGNDRAQVNISASVLAMSSCPAQVAYHQRQGRGLLLLRDEKHCVLLPAIHLGSWAADIGNGASTLAQG